MRLTQILFKHNKVRIAKLRWEHARKKEVPDSLTIAAAEKFGLNASDPKEIFDAVALQCRPRTVLPEKPQVVGYLPKEQPLNKEHPLYKSRSCYTLGDSNVLIQGTKQAGVLLNTSLKETLPSCIEDLVGAQSVSEQNIRVQRSIMHSHAYDAMQELLPVRKDPLRPAWRFPRDYGITAHRRFQLITSDLLQLCDEALGSQSLANRTIIHDAFCNVLLDVNGKLIQIENTADILVTSKNPLPALVPRDSENDTVHPDLYPLSSTVSMKNSHFYHNGSIYPLTRDTSLSHPHTLFVLYDPTVVKNLTEEPVTEDQYFSRTLIKAFTVAASRAHQLYGEDVKQLPEPLTVQVVQTNGQKYHFGVFQLNTLDLGNSQGEKNIFWMLPSNLEMFSFCGYEKGKPKLADYNPEVFRRILAFYRHGVQLS